VRADQDPLTPAQRGGRRGGIGPDRHDPVTAIVNGVEKGVAPTSITASRVVNNKEVLTRPLCPYPQVAKYSGQGSIDDAANFSCIAPIEIPSWGPE
jgi:feruloyl esterase